MYSIYGMVVNHTLNSFYIGGWKEKSAELVRADLGSEVFGVQNKNRREAGCGIADCGIPIPAGIDTPDPRSGGMRNRESGAMQERFLFFGTVLAMFQDTAGTNQIDDGRDVGGIDSEFEYIHRL